MLEPEQRSSSNDIPDDNHLRLGLNRWLQIFITQSFYLFLVRPTSTNEEPQQQPPTMPAQHGLNTIQSEQAMRERSLAGLVTFIKNYHRDIHQIDQHGKIVFCLYRNLIFSF